MISPKRWQDFRKLWVTKTPLVQWKPYQSARAPWSQIETWYSQNPDANIGIVTGAISGIVVVDFDSQEAFEGFERLLGNLHEESYIYVQDVRATSYGYGGKTQEFRYHA